MQKIDLRMSSFFFLGPFWMLSNPDLLLLSVLVNSVEKWRCLWLTCNEWVPKTQCFSSELQMGRILGQNFKHTQTNHLGNLPIQICFGQISEEGFPYGATELGWALEIGYWVGRLNSPHQIWTNIYENPWKKLKGSTKKHMDLLRSSHFGDSTFKSIIRTQTLKTWSQLSSRKSALPRNSGPPPCWSLETGEV